MPTPAAPEEIPALKVEQTDTRQITITYPADPEPLAEALHEAAIAGFAIVDAVVQNEIVGPQGGLKIRLTRKVKP